LTIVFYSGFSKPLNSTRRPSGGVTIEGELKRDFTPLAPVVELRAVSPVNMPQYNYCRIPAFERYYYITEWVYIGGQWQAALTCDVLASYKDAIGAQTCYILRAASRYNGAIPDTTYPITADPPTVLSHSITNGPYPLDNDEIGTFVLGIINNKAGAGSVCYYAFSYAGLNNFMGLLLSSIDWMGISADEISTALQKGLINPMQYIVSCRYYPISYAYLNNLPYFGTDSQIVVGWWPFQQTAMKLGGLFDSVRSQKRLNIPKHPQAGARGNYLNLSPYSKYTLFAFPFGTIDIDAASLQGYSVLLLDYDLGLISGGSTLTISVEGMTKPLRVIKAQSGVDIPLAQISIDNFSGGTLLQGAISGITQMFSGMFSGGGSQSGGTFNNLMNSLGAKFAELIGGDPTPFQAALPEGYQTGQSAAEIGSAAGAAMASVNYLGGTPDASDYGVRISLVGTFYQIAAEDRANRGRPLCERRRVDTLTGFVQCANVELTEFPGTLEEQKIARAAMEGGILYE
jgi:hypothetical protein